MLPFEIEDRSRWAHLPEVEPPARLRESVLADWQRDYGSGSGRAAGAFATAAVAALFVLGVALSARMQPSAVVDPAVAILRAHGVEVIAPPTVTRPSEVQRIALGSAAARVGLRVGDRLLAFDAGSVTGSMLNVAVLRGSSPRYFALPGSPAIALDTRGGMGQLPAPTRRAPRVGVNPATTTRVAASSNALPG